MVDRFNPEDVLASLFTPRGATELHVYSGLATRAMEWGMAHGLIEKRGECLYRLTTSGRERFQ
jgi:hypothetical protein